MNRRSFLTALAASAFMRPSLGTAQEAGHPFAALVNPDTGRNYEPQEGKFALALFMSAQESYPDCGGAFIGVHQTLAFSRWSSYIEPVLVMPKISDQSNPSDINNLRRAKSAATPYTILTGPLPDVLLASEKVQGAYFKLNAAGRISGHTLDAFLLTPRGNMIFHHRADDHFTMVDLVDRAIGHCQRPLLGNICD